MQTTAIKAPPQPIANLPADRLFRQCPLGCNGRLEDSGIALPEGPLLRCSLCGQFLSSCTTSQHEAALGKWDATAGTSPNARSVARYRKVNTRRLQTALSLLEPGVSAPRLLDVGCSSGALLGLAVSMAFAVTGVEPAPKAAQTARQAGFDVFTGFLQEARYPDRAFDVVTVFEIIEHVTDPLVLIAECRRVLRPGGVLVINTPNAQSWTARFMKQRWEGFSLAGLGGHVSFFSPSTVASMAQRLNMQVALTETRNVRFYEEGQCNPLRFRLAKIAAQLLAYPARFSGSGHDLLVFMQRL